LDGVAIAEVGGQRNEAGLLFGGVEATALEQDATAHHHLEANGAPLAAADFCLIECDPSAFVEPAEDAPGKVDVALEVAFESHHAFRSAVDEDGSRHLGEDLGFEVGR